MNKHPLKEELREFEFPCDKTLEETPNLHRLRTIMTALVLWVEENKNPNRYSEIGIDYHLFMSPHEKHIYDGKLFIIQNEAGDWFRLIWRDIAISWKKDPMRYLQSSREITYAESLQLIAEFKEELVDEIQRDPDAEAYE